MIKFINNVYDYSPIFFQNAMMTIYGAYLYYQRYGQVQKSHLESLQRSQWYPASELEELRFDQLTRLLRHAYENVPFYRILFKKNGIKPKQIRDISDLSKLPVITKEDIRQNPRRFIANSPKGNKLIRIYTSGTTGTPLTLYFDRTAVQRNYAFFARALEWAGVCVGERSATFGGRVFIPRNQIAAPFWRTNKLVANTLFSSYHISERTLPLYFRRLEQLRPVFIDSYPSAIYPIARYIIEKGYEGRINPRAIITSSETLTIQQRWGLERAFNCKVFDQYGSAEMVALITQCERGSYHVNPEYGIIEFGPAQGVEKGELVCTGFLNYAMPLIRYKIGDRAFLSTQPCTCGRPFEVVDSIEGRLDDTIITRDGRVIGRLDPIFKGCASIKECEVIQEQIDTLKLRIVRGTGLTRSVIDKVVDELKKRIGYDIVVKIEYVNEIPRTPAGKLRAVVCKLPATERARYIRN